MQSYNLRRITVVAPSVTNAGEASGYADEFADALDSIGQNYTRHAEHIGSWNGTRETGVEFEILGAPDELDPRAIGHLARVIMQDQEAIQVVDHGLVTVWEA